MAFSSGGARKKEVTVKFLIGVLLVRFLLEAVSKKDKNANVHKADVKNSNVRHPAEYELR